MANTKIVLNRQSDLILDNAQITNPTGIVLADISGVSEAVASINTATSLDMSAEASARVAGDVSVTAAMSAETSTRIVAETSLQNNIDAEASTGLVRDNAEASMARAAEQSLATDLDAEQSRAESAEASLNAKVENVISNVDPAALDSLTEIVGAFQSADGDLNGAITALGSSATAAVDNEASIRLAADQSLAGDLSSEIADREAAVSLEEAARISGDASVNADLSAEVEARISDVNAEQARAESAEASLDAAKLNLAGGTMSGNIDMGGKEVFNALNLQGDYITTTYMQSGVENQPITVYSDLYLNYKRIIYVAPPTGQHDATNKNYVDDADNSIASDLWSEISTRTTEMSSEVSIRLSTDVSLDNQLSNEVEYFTSTISNEVSARQSADASIDDSKLSRDGSQYMNGDLNIGGYGINHVSSIGFIDGLPNAVVFTNDISSNGTTKVTNLPAPTDDADAANKLYVDSADQSLATALSSEISDRGVVIDAEASSRVAGDLSLQNQIDFITSNVDAAAIDSLTEIVAAFQSADGDINGAITALSSTATSGLSTEVARAESAEASLDAAKLDLAGGTMTGNIIMSYGEITNLSLVGTDMLLNSAGVSGLVFDGNNIQFGTGKFTDLLPPTNGGDAANKSYVDSADQSLATALSSTVSTEESIRLAADESLATDLSSEISARLEAGSSIAADLSSTVSTEESIRLAADASIATELSSEIAALADVDGTTIVLNGDTNQIELKENIAAPASGIRTFAGEVDVETILKVGGVDVMATISSEISRAESAEDSLEIALSSEVSYLLANTDLTSIDSFAEVSDAVSAEISRAESAELSLANDFAAIYFKKATFTGTIDNVNNQFTLASSVRGGSETVYLNGLLQEAGVDYTVAGDVISFDSAPKTGDKVVIYAVY